MYIESIRLEVGRDYPSIGRCTRCRPTEVSMYCVLGDLFGECHWMQEVTDEDRQGKAGTRRDEACGKAMLMDTLRILNTYKIK